MYATGHGDCNTKKSSSIRLRNDSGSGKYWPTIKRATRLSQPTFALKIDYIQANGSAISNFFTAVIVGLILSFIVIPTISPTTGVGLMQIAAFI